MIPISYMRYLAAAKSQPSQVVFHKDLFTSVVIFFVVCALWGLFQFFRGQPPSGSYLGALIIGIGLLAVQGISGLILVGAGYQPRDWTHWLYGFVLLFTIPFIYATWAQRTADRRAALYYALGCVLIVVIALVRQTMTGSG